MSKKNRWKEALF